ncbi:MULTISPECIES: hypothetical protein [unclassified Microcoleus]|uniref:hypothetical protein n=1 Tax=unclassified Microcoleus TaxID=2642155 RepID=UPI002FD43166
MTSEVNEVPLGKNSSDSGSNTSLLPEDAQKTALSNVSRLLSEVGSASPEALQLKRCSLVGSAVQMLV